MNFEKKLIRLRKTKGLSQEELAERLGVSRQAVSRWGSGNTTPDLVHFKLLCELFGVSADYLLSDEVPTEGSPAAECLSKEEKIRKRLNFLLIAVFSWLVAAVAFLLAAIASQKTGYVIMTVISAILAGVVFRQYDRRNDR